MFENTTNRHSATTPLLFPGSSVTFLPVQIFLHRYIFSIHSMYAASILLNQPRNNIYSITHPIVFCRISSCISTAHDETTINIFHHRSLHLPTVFLLLLHIAK